MGVYRSYGGIRSYVRLWIFSLRIITNKNTDMSLDQLRVAIEEKDHAIITLIAERMKIVQAIAREKEWQGLPVRIPEQANAVLDRAAAEAERLGLDAEPVVAIFEILVRMSEELQEERRKDGAGKGK